MSTLTVAGGYRHGRPDGRPEKPLDIRIEEAIGRFGFETRLYPDVYSWAVADAVNPELGWDEMFELPLGAVVLFDGHPYQKVRENYLVGGKLQQSWAGAGCARLVEDCTPITLLYVPEARE